MLLKITGQYKGTVNNSTIDGNATGIIDTTGDSTNKLEIQFNSIPDNVHPLMAGNCWNSSYHALGISPSKGAVNLFNVNINKKDYIAGRTVRWASLPNDKLVLNANVSIDMDAGVVNATQQVSGTYSGPIDLIAVENYKMLWKQISRNKIEITSNVKILRKNNKFLDAQIVSAYTGEFDDMPTKSQVGTYNFNNQSFSNNLLSFDWHGVVKKT